MTRRLWSCVLHSDEDRCRTVGFELLFEPRDLWWGVYWDRRSLRHAEAVPPYDLATRWRELHLYVIPLVPTLVLHFVWAYGFASKLEQRHID